MSNNEQKPDFLFGKENYKFLIIGLVVIAIGFILMSGSSNNNPSVWNADIMSFRRIRLAPTVVLIGFAITIYSIFRKDKDAA
ncbi:DUF3098 domain-containing protein [Flavobacterium sp.]|jgi:hypothetical protein|uniref:DUF3098 domain-containing protein n=1 Tax=Flavobacterium sp. TaxID=239 RepID=UPI0026141F61|nr:DUF3098 domain-containing protein [Flavobacterium sp.]